MAASSLVKLLELLDDAKCFTLVRQHRWPTGVQCARCDSSAITRDGHDDAQLHQQRYRCKTCTGRFDDLTGTVLAGHHQPLRVWVLCFYLMGLNLSNRQIAAELGVGISDVQAMTEKLRYGLVARISTVTLQGEAEVDKVSIKPIITGAITPGTLIYNDEYGIYPPLEHWAYSYKTVWPWAR